MKHGKRNIIAGGVIIFLAAAGGFGLGFTLDPLYEDGFYKVSYGRGLIKAGHTHGMPFALYNLIVGTLIAQLVLSDVWKNRLSWLAIGTILMPIGLILRGLQDGAMTFAPVVMIGALCFLISAGLIVKGAMGETE